jgi:anti-sigma factor RsiW
MRLLDMKKIDDETLMAYADSELDEGEKKEVELALVGDAEGRARLRDFKVTGAAISRYAAILEEGVIRRGFNK